MPLATGPNVDLDNTWKLIAENASDVLISLLGAAPAVIALASAAPAPGSADGHRLHCEAGRDAFPMSGLTGEKVYARSLLKDTATTIAVSKG